MLESRIKKASDVLDHYRSWPGFVNQPQRGGKQVSVIGIAQLFACHRKGRAGNPAASRSMPLYTEPSTCLMSVCKTFQDSLFLRNVVQQAGSRSNKEMCSNPASSSPKACPPPPAHNSTQTGPDIAQHSFRFAIIHGAVSGSNSLLSFRPRPIKHRDLSSLAGTHTI